MVSPAAPGVVCPRCKATLTPEANATGLSCASCRGIFVYKEALQAVLAEATPLGGAVSYRQSARPSVDANAARGRGAFEPDFKYIACPMCGRVMNRQNFLKRSGVIVDQCLHHGTWFDADEAQRAASYVASVGGAPSEPTEKPRSAEKLSRAEVLIAFLRG